jgi:cytochrome c
MIRVLMTLIGFTMAVLQPMSALADDRRQGFSPLALQQHCDECHAIQEIAIGPPFRAVALRYAPDRAVAAERLARKIINGGAGNWGTIPMVPNERVSLEDARGIARWILSLADTK